MVLNMVIHYFIEMSPPPCVDPFFRGSSGDPSILPSWRHLVPILACLRLNDVSNRVFPCALTGS